MNERLTDAELDEVRASSEYAEPLIAELNSYKTALRALFDEIDSDPPDPHRVAQFTAAYEAAKRLLFPGEAP